MSTCADGAARPCRQPLLLAPLLSETVYGNNANIAWGFRSLTIGISIAGGFRPGVSEILNIAFDASVADIRRDAQDARKQEMLAREQLSNALSWVSYCLKELAAQKNAVRSILVAIVKYRFPNASFPSPFRFQARP